MSKSVFIKESGVDTIIHQHTDGHLALAGLKCRHCGHIAFPAINTCITCGKTDMEPVDLAATGILYTYTQTMRPVNHMPAGAITGYVDLDDGVRIFAPIDVEEGKAPKIGAPVQIVFRPLWTEDDGTEVIGYAAKQIKETE